MQLIQAKWQLYDPCSAQAYTSTMGTESGMGHGYDWYIQCGAIKMWSIFSNIVTRDTP